jgi:hypothetical protein
MISISFCSLQLLVITAFSGESLQQHLYSVLNRGNVRVDKVDNVLLSMEMLTVHGWHFDCDGALRH